MEIGSWFRHQGTYYIKCAAFLRGQTTYQAVSLVDGSPSFPVRTSSADSPALSDVDVEVLEKPDWATIVNHTLEFKADGHRAEIAEELQKDFPGIEIRLEDKTGKFFLHYTSTKAVYYTILSRARYGG